MEIKGSNRSNILKQLLIISGGVLLILLLVLLNEGEPSKDAVKKENTELAVNRPNTIALDFQDIIDRNLHSIYRDSSLSIHLVEQYSTPYLVYIYKGELTERQLTDRFSLHVYLKDSTKAKTAPGAEFLNLDFDAVKEAQTASDDGIPYHVYKRKLNHTSYIGGMIEPSNIDRIFTGRFKLGVGRSFGTTISFDSIKSISLRNTLPDLKLEIAARHYRRIKSHRDEAVSLGVIRAEHKELFPAVIKVGNGADDIKAELRLKGDWTDHVRDSLKWSFRVVADGEKTYRGMRKFSVQHPKVRQFAWEWLLHRVVKKEDLIGLRYDYVNLSLSLKNDTLNGEIPMGIMAVEESFDKILLENNRRREGIVLAFDESFNWKDVEKKLDLDLDDQTHRNNVFEIETAPIRLYNENKVLSDPNLKKQFETAKNLLDGYRKGLIPVSESFDIEKLTSYVALLNLFGGTHGLAFINLKFYYNPITGKLEPIAFDTNSGGKIDRVTNFHLSADDPLYQEKITEKLLYYSSQEFLDSLVEEFGPSLDEIVKNLNTEFSTQIDMSVLEYNSNMIKRAINPASPIMAEFLDINDEKLTLRASNLSDFNISVDGLQHRDGKELDDMLEPIELPSRSSRTIEIDLKQSFVNAFVAKKTKKASFRYPNDVDKLRLSYHLNGMNLNRLSMIKAFGLDSEIEGRAKSITDRNTPNIRDFDFVQVDESNKEIRLAGNIQLDRTLVVPMGYKLVVSAGTTIDLNNNASIISFSPVQMVGSEKEPIQVTSSEKTGGGIFVTGSKQLSQVSHVNFSGLSNPQDEYWSLSGAVNFHETKVDISNSVFESNRCEDALNIIRSEFVLTSSSFKDTMSDAFDGDFVKGEIRDSSFTNCGNDGVDVSGSKIHLEHIIIDNPSDKAISAGEASEMSGNNITVSGGEIGIVSKDLSTVDFSTVLISGTRLGFSAFQKKSEFGAGRINIDQLSISGADEDYLIETGSELIIDGTAVATVTNAVIEQMYGKEYGKSSK